MADNHLKRARTGLSAIVLIFFLIMLSLPSLGSSHARTDVDCEAGFEGSELDAFAVDENEGGVGAYAYAEANFYFRGAGHIADGPNYDDAVVTANAERRSFPWDLALDAYAEGWAESDGEHDPANCSHSFPTFNGEGWEKLPPGLQDHLSVVSCVKNDATTSYAYSGEIYHDAQVNTTFLWQGGDGLNITANPDLNSDTPSITGMTSQAQSEGLHIDAYGSSSWGCELEINWS